MCYLLLGVDNTVQVFRYDRRSRRWIDRETGEIVGSISGLRADVIGYGIGRVIRVPGKGM